MHGAGRIDHGNNPCDAKVSDVKAQIVNSRNHRTLPPTPGFGFATSGS
jgi:hypothetical protein